MSGVSLPVTRPAGRALLIGSQSCRSEPLDRLNTLGVACGEADDPYAAMVELSRRSSLYQYVVVSLQSLYREELAVIAAIKKRWPHLDVWLTQTDGRGAALAEAMRLGADGLLTDDGLVRTAPTPPAVALFRPLEEPPAGASAHQGDKSAEEESPSDRYLDDATSEPVLTPEELAALLQDPPVSAQRRND